MSGAAGGAVAGGQGVSVGGVSVGRAFGEASVPRFARGFRFRLDPVRQQWLVLGPERAFVPDEIAAEVLRLVDGQAQVGAMIDGLAARFAAPRAQIAADVFVLLEALAGKGVLRISGTEADAAGKG